MKPGAIYVISIVLQPGKKIDVLFFKIITHLKPHLSRLNTTTCDILHLENYVLQPCIQSFAKNSQF